MFDITILAVGRIKEKYYAEAIAEYLKRVRPYAKVDVRELRAEAFAGNTREEAKRKEGERILRFLDGRADSSVYLLTEGGEQYDSAAFARLLAGADKPLIFIVGGALGFSPEVTARVTRRLSLSPLTFPHELARLVLIEQVYRAAMIDVGKTYHY